MLQLLGRGFQVRTGLARIPLIELSHPPGASQKRIVRGLGNEQLEFRGQAADVLLFEEQFQDKVNQYVGILTNPINLPEDAPGLRGPHLEAEQVEQISTSLDLSCIPFGDTPEALLRVGGMPLLDGEQTQRHLGLGPARVCLWDGSKQFDARIAMVGLQLDLSQQDPRFSVLGMVSDPQFEAGFHLRPPAALGGSLNLVPIRRRRGRTSGPDDAHDRSHPNREPDRGQNDRQTPAKCMTSAPNVLRHRFALPRSSIDRTLIPDYSRCERFATTLSVSRGFSRLGWSLGSTAPMVKASG